MRALIVASLLAAAPATLDAAPILIDLTTSPDTLSPGDVSLLGTTDVSSTLSFDEILAEFGVVVDEQLYKSEADGDPESGRFADDYTTVYSNTATDPSDALITWNGPEIIACPVCYVLVKDGNQSPAQYLFDIGSWNGTDSITLLGFWPRKGAISHVAIYSGAVPEPGTLSLVLCGLAGLAVRARTRRSRRLA